MVLLTILCLWSFSAMAGGRESGRKPDHHYKAEAAMRKKEFRRGISLDEAVSRVRAETSGRVLSVQELDSEYRVCLLTPDGVVRRLRIDPATGEILR
ncbi:peptidase [Thiolapillus brandeum]|uniref:Peptidase n=2 Tax=Thiolapillus brandeum TaxID=1076588 RepID=A0A7U6JIE5_9GAMM|nr:peptidase [Thiolapillus brandeum]